jgi:putative zinc finger/helix-turn-helix YgiT family protein
MGESAGYIHSQVIHLSNGGARRCVNCGQETASCEYVDQEFHYGEGKDQVVLSARVPVWSCSSCGFQYTDGTAEEIRHETICRYLGRLTPKELRDIREYYRLSQNDWAQRTGIGIASVKRWETGNQIQNESTDRYVRLLAQPDIFARLQRYEERPGVGRQNFRFQTLLSPETRQLAAFFELRRRRHG